MNKEDLERIANVLIDFPYGSDKLLDASIKCKEIEVLQEISESLKSIAKSLGPQDIRTHGWGEGLRK